MGSKLPVDTANFSSIGRVVTSLTFELWKINRMVSFEPDLSVTDQSNLDFDTISLIPPVIQILAREHPITPCWL